jgi:hypothetical protein
MNLVLTESSLYFVVFDEVIACNTKNQNGFLKIPEL